MTHGLYWGLPVILYLFLAGAGAGAVAVSASMQLRAGDSGKRAYRDIARYGALLGPLPVIIGVGLLVFDLESFQAGHLFRFINLYLTINLSPMSIGTWLLTFFIISSLAYAYTYQDILPFPGDRASWRRRLAWINVPLGLCVAIYTGVLLGAMPSRPFWNSPILAMLFVCSALSTGTALIIFAHALLNHHSAHTDEQPEVGQPASYILAATDTMLIGFELLTLLLFLMFAYLTVGNARFAVATILPGGSLATMFWLGVVLIGLVLPGLLELYFIIPSLLQRRQFAGSRYAEMGLAAAILLGGFLLRYVVVVAGQITGPVGL